MWPSMNLVFAGCEYDGLVVNNGWRFTPPSAPCDVCTCTDGSASCQYIDCPELGPCSSQTVLDGECCPTCLDCGDRDNGETWRETACQQCTCVVTFP